MAAVRKVESGTKNADVVRRLFNSGLNETVVARRSGVPVAQVRQIIGATKARGRTVAEPAARRTPSGLPEVEQPIARGKFNRELEVGHQMPAFADHDRHIKAVMAQGGFVALSRRSRNGQVSYGLPLIRPVLVDGVQP